MYRKTTARHIIAPIGKFGCMRPCPTGLTESAGNQEKSTEIDRAVYCYRTSQQYESTGDYYYENKVRVQ